jgi:hypothetical protein
MIVRTNRAIPGFTSSFSCRYYYIDSRVWSHLRQDSIASGIVISQIYGAGGNSGAAWRNDFVELFNSSSGTSI